MDSEHRCSVEQTTRQVIEAKLLTALNDSNVVAILASQEDLCIMIAALSRYPDSKAHKMAEDFGQLERAAFK